MSETLSYQPETTTETVPDNLTPEEQDSLAVGEKMQAAEDNLLAGKYKNAQELEKAYVELQKKLGEDEPQAETAEAEPEEAIPNTYGKDGSVNYETVSETYGSEISGLLEKAGVDPWAISKEFHDNQGQYTDEMVNSLVNAGLSEAAVRSYFAGRAAEEGYTTGNSSAADLAEADIASVKNSVGGEAAYQNIMTWAGKNLDEEQIKAFDDVVGEGSVAAIKLAVSGLKAQYENANGFEGKMYTGKPPKTSGDVFRSQAELVRAMSDPRYDQDPAYRQDIIEKLDRSDLEF
tara:strand:- start:154 stop:1023 length:870 start_codon:yes stop_codon:yes gene_type:complete